MVNKKAFSLMALIIFLLITLIGLAVMAPVMTKRNNMPSSNQNSQHGAFVCIKRYNGANWQLFQGQMDSEDNATDLTVVGNCTFSPPAGVDNFQVTLIGGGGGGAASTFEYNEMYPSNDTNATRLNLNFTPQNNFSDELSSGQEVRITNTGSAEERMGFGLIRNAFSNALEKLSINITVEGGGGASGPPAMFNDERISLPTGKGIEGINGLWAFNSCRCTHPMPDNITGNSNIAGCYAQGFNDSKGTEFCRSDNSEVNNFCIVHGYGASGTRCTYGYTPQLNDVITFGSGKGGEYKHIKTAVTGYGVNKISGNDGKNGIIKLERNSKEENIAIKGGYGGKYRTLPETGKIVTELGKNYISYIDENGTCVCKGLDTNTPNWLTNLGNGLKNIFIEVTCNAACGDTEICPVHANIDSCDTSTSSLKNCKQYGNSSGFVTNLKCKGSTTGLTYIPQENELYSGGAGAKGGVRQTADASESNALALAIKKATDNVYEADPNKGKGGDGNKPQINVSATVNGVTLGAPSNFNLYAKRFALRGLQGKEGGKGSIISFPTSSFTSSGTNETITIPASSIGDGGAGGTCFDVDATGVTTYNQNSCLGTNGGNTSFLGGTANGGEGGGISPIALSGDNIEENAINNTTIEENWLVTTGLRNTINQITLRGKNGEINVNAFSNISNNYLRKFQIGEQSLSNIIQQSKENLQRREHSVHEIQINNSIGGSGAGANAQFSGYDCTSPNLCVGPRIYLSNDRETPLNNIDATNATGLMQNIQVHNPTIGVNKYFNQAHTEQGGFEIGTAQTGGGGAIIITW